MNDQTASAVRSVLKIAGAFVVSKGLTDNAGLEQIIGGVIALIGIAWSYFHHKQDAATKAPVANSTKE